MTRNDNTEIPDNRQMIYKKLWTLSMPTKIKLMMWRALQGFISIGQTLFNRRIRNTAICPRCNAELETFLHVIADCNQVKNVWEAIWWACNRQVMEGKSITRQETTAKIISMLAEIDVLKEKLPAVREVDIDRWKPPSFGFAKVEVEGDSRTAIEKINQKENSRTDLDSAIVDIKDIGRTFHQIRFKHARREANRVAHFIAREGHSKSENTFWMKDTPD
ncbi:hypothetical protein Goarm_011325 [Gossypium armourianum]|uniref:Reverse transcriptase n=1 Tax=Gossypium armourianum TaxID=34283 RepID=A0A7J9IWH7_9ROSI|nr:hypothetical protein [Gossypium armourianum]